MSVDRVNGYRHDAKKALKKTSAISCHYLCIYDPVPKYYAGTGSKPKPDFLLKPYPNPIDQNDVGIEIEKNRNVCYEMLVWISWKAAKFHGWVDKPQRMELYDRQTTRMWTTEKDGSPIKTPLSTPDSLKGFANDRRSKRSFIKTAAAARALRNDKEMVCYFEIDEREIWLASWKHCTYVWRATRDKIIARVWRLSGREVNP